MINTLLSLAYKVLICSYASATKNNYDQGGVALYYIHIYIIHMCQKAKWRLNYNFGTLKLKQGKGKGVAIFCHL